jgi:anti-sigma B factor antagonist
MIAQQTGVHVMTSAETIDGISVASLPERFNASNCLAFQKDIEPLMKENPRLIFDLTQVRMMDSSALGTLIACLKHVRSHGGDLRLCGMSNKIRALFELVRMHHIFDVFNTLEEALDSYKKQSA